MHFVKTLTFFNEKGGSGKTTFCLMMASWLRYRCGYRVAVIDLDGPMHGLNEMRAIDLDVMRNEGRYLLPFIGKDCDPQRDWYPVITADIDGGEEDQKLMDSLIRSLKDDYDYVVIDFGGSFGKGDAVVRFISSRLLDLMVVPIYTDEIVLLSALELSYRCSPSGQPRVVFWNRVTRSERDISSQDRLAPFSRLFADEGIPILKTRIPDMVMFRRDCRTWRFLRSTACWPQANVSQLCPELETLFTEIKTLLDKGQDKR